jgi:hypothetical protein
MDPTAATAEPDDSIMAGPVSAERESAGVVSVGPVSAGPVSARTEVAELLGCRPGTVGSLLHRALAALRIQPEELP